jgi:hypothetical protein
VSTISDVDRVAAIEDAYRDGYRRFLSLALGRGRSSRFRQNKQRRIMKTFGLCLAALAAAVTLTAVAAAGPDATQRRFTFTEDGVRFSFNVAPRPPGAFVPIESIATDKLPAGPISLNKSVNGAQSAEAIIYWTSFPDGDYADWCARLLSPSAGASAAKLATAVSRAPGTKLVTGPSNLTLGGRPAKHVVLTVRKNVGCEPGFFYRWEDVSGGTLWPRTGVGATIRVWIVTVNKTRLFIAAATNKQATPGLKKEISQIVESIRFD